MSVARNLRRLLKKKDLPSKNNKVFLEPLEPRLLLDAVTAHWVGGSGNWSDPTHWDIGYAPNDRNGNTYTAIIDVANSDVVVNVTQGVKVSGLLSSETIEVDAGGVLSASGTVNNAGDLKTNGGTLTLNGATVTNTGHTITVDEGAIELTNSIITGGTIQSTLASGSVTVGGSSTLDAVILNADTTITDNNSLTIINGLTLNSKLTLASDTSTCYLNFNGNQTISGNGQIVLGGTGNNTIILQSGTTTLGSDIILLDSMGGQILGAEDVETAIINQGEIIVAPSATMGINTTSIIIDNYGRLLADSGSVLSVSDSTFTIQYYGNISVSDSSTFSVSNSSFTIQDYSGIYVNPGSTFSVSDSLFNIKGSVGNMRSGGTIWIDPGSTFSVSDSLFNIQDSSVIWIDDGSTYAVSNSSFIFQDRSYISVQDDSTFSVLGSSFNFLGVGMIWSYDGSTISLYDSSFDFQEEGMIYLYGSTLSLSNSSFIISDDCQIDSWYGSTLSLSNSSFIVKDQDWIYLENINIGNTNDPNSLDVFASYPDGFISVIGNLLGATRNADQYTLLGTTSFEGSGTAASPQLLEVMGQDLGEDAAGFTHNFVYGTLALNHNTYVKLVDQSDNSTGIGNEAIYIDTLVVPSGTTLDLNGLHLYARGAQIGGTIVGTITQITDSGDLAFATQTPGTISVAGELDEWNFYGREGRAITTVVNTAPLSPNLSWVEVTLLDASDNVIATKSSTASGQIITLDDIALPSDGNYRLQIRAPIGHLTSTGNYQVAVWDVTADVSPLVLNQQRMGTIETPYSVDRWVFSGIAGQQVRFDFINASGSGIAFDLKGPDSWTGFTGIANDSDLINIPTSGSYTLTAHGTGDQYNTTYAFRLFETTVTDLAANTTYTGTFAGSSQAELFSVNIPDTIPMKVTLNDTAINNHNELYIKFGSAPTRADYDYSFTSMSSSDQQILVPMAKPGTWYILVCGDTIDTPSAYTLEARTANLIVNSVTPDIGGTTVGTTLTLTGTGYDSSTNVSLVSQDGTKYSAIDVTINSFTQITATFAPNLVPAGTYSVIVSQTDGDNDQLNDCFTMIENGQANFEAHLIVPSDVGRHATATLYIEYANTGDAAMPAPLLVISSGDPDGSDRPILTLDQSKQIENLWTSAIPEGSSASIQILASGKTPGVLQPGESFKVPVYYSGLQQPWDFSDTQVEFNLGVLTADNTASVDWLSLKDTMRPSTIATDAWDGIFASFVAGVGSTWGDYVSMLDENAVYLGQLGENVVDIGQLLTFEFMQADSIGPVQTISGSIDAAVEAPGMPIVFSRFFEESISNRYDLGRLGYGWADNWDYSLATRTDGTVDIMGPGGSQRTFQPDSRYSGRYFHPDRRLWNSYPDRWRSIYSEGNQWHDLCLRIRRQAQLCGRHKPQPYHLRLYRQFPDKPYPLLRSIAPDYL